MNDNTEIFKLHEFNLEKIYVDEQSDYIVALSINNKAYGVQLNSYEGTILTFVNFGCAEHSHINTIHQILLKFNQNIGYNLKRIIVEAKYGDVTYCRLHWAHKDSKKDIYNVMSLGDALILGHLAKAKMFITDFVVQQLEPMDSDGFMQVYED